MRRGTVLIGGSTASGKSALALALAEATGGVVINADSVQLYRDLPILTARPGAADLARAEHRLYGILEAHEPASVAAWLGRADVELLRAAAADRLAIVTGGTGLYFKALLEGLPVMPDIPASVRDALRARPDATPALHRELAARDPALAARLQPTDRQRILRGLEVALATGRPLSTWQTDPPRQPFVPEPVVGQALLPPPEQVDPRIAARLDGMLQAGLLDELRAFRAGPGRRPSPLAKADGVAEFTRYLEGFVDLDAAKRATIIKVRRYAKRQRTFFRGQLGAHLPPLAAVAEAGSVASLVQALSARLAEMPQPHARG